MSTSARRWLFVGLGFYASAAHAEPQGDGFLMVGGFVLASGAISGAVFALRRERLRGSLAYSLAIVVLISFLLLYFALAPASLELGSGQIGMIAFFTALIGASFAIGFVPAHLLVTKTRK